MSGSSEATDRIGAARVADALVELWRSGELERSLQVASNSMAPLIRAGDRVVVQGGGKPRPGDVVLYRLLDRLITHRVLAVRDSPPRTIRAKGDAALQVDDWVGEDQVVGRVVRIERRGRRLELGDEISQRMGLLIARVSHRAAVSDHPTPLRLHLVRLLVVALGATTWLVRRR